MKYRPEIIELKEIPNVGPATIRYLNIIGVNIPFEMVGQDPYSLFEKLCQTTGKQFDPCLLDVFISAVKYMEGAPKKMWWEYTKERKRNLKATMSEFQPSKNKSKN